MYSVELARFESYTVKLNTRVFEDELKLFTGKFNVVLGEIVSILIDLLLRANLQLPNSSQT